MMTLSTRINPKIFLIGSKTLNHSIIFLLVFSFNYFSYWIFAALKTSPVVKDFYNMRMIALSVIVPVQNESQPAASRTFQRTRVWFQEFFLLFVRKESRDKMKKSQLFFPQLDFVIEQVSNEVPPNINCIGRSYFLS